MPATSAAARSRGESHARTARSARGQDGACGGTASRGPPLSAAALWPRRRSPAWSGVVVEPGSPAEAERAVDQGLVPADRDIGADLEIGPAQLVFDLLVALLDPVADRVYPHDLGQARGRVRTVWLARAAGPGQVRDQVPGGLGRQSGRVGGGNHQAPGAVRPPPAQRRINSPPGLGMPVAERPGHWAPVARIVRAVPGQRAGRIDRGVRIRAMGPGPAARLERHHERQPGLRQLGAEPVLVPVRALRKFTSVMSGVSAGERAAGCSSIPRGRRVA